MREPVRVRTLDQRHERGETRDGVARIEPARSHPIEQRNPAAERGQHRRTAGGVDDAARGRSMPSAPHASSWC